MNPGEPCYFVSTISTLLKRTTSGGLQQRIGRPDSGPHPPLQRPRPVGAWTRCKEPPRREFGALSTQPDLTPQWKEEVNRRLAAHKNRKSQSHAPETEQAAPGVGASRAAEAAARVAARYSRAPSYSQLQAEEARVAVREAEIATKVALEAQAVAHTVLAELHAASQQKPSRGPAVVQPIAPLRNPEIEPVTTAPPGSAAVEEPGPATALATAPPANDSAPELIPAQPDAPAVRRVFDIRWDPDMPVRPVESKPAQRRVHDEFELSVEDWWSPAEVRESLRSNPIEIDNEEEGRANLIQFPRELVATRKIRPRLAEEGAAPTDEKGQLSIFEVDPKAISTVVAVAAAEQGGATSTWSGMRLDAEPSDARASGSKADPVPSSLPVAPIGSRVLAAVVDGSLILAGFVSIGFLAAHSFPHPPAGKAADVLGVAALVIIGILYYAIFFALPVSTPGMMYAGIGLCTFNDLSPTRAQLRRRLGAMLLSLLPVGLGVVWALFDDDHLSWHDRFSQTYPRKL
jgi:uncharacterized RDD family membrane protein YckC